MYVSSSITESQVELTYATTETFPSVVTDNTRLAGGEMNWICISSSSDRRGERVKERDTFSSSEEDCQ